MIIRLFSFLFLGKSGYYAILFFRGWELLISFSFQIYLLKIFIISFLLLLFFKCIRSIALFFLIPDTGNVMSVLFLIIFDRDLSILLFFLEN